MLYLSWYLYFSASLLMSRRHVRITPRVCACTVQCACRTKDQRSLSADFEQFMTRFEFVCSHNRSHQSSIHVPVYDLLLFDRGSEVAHHEVATGSRPVPL